MDTFVLTPSYTPTNGNSNMSHMKPGGRTVVRPYNVGGGCKQSRLHIKCRDAPRCVRTYIHEYRQEHTDGRTAVRPYRVGKGCTQSRLHIKCRDAPRCVRTCIHEYRQEHTGGRTVVRPYNVGGGCTQSRLHIKHVGTHQGASAHASMNTDKNIRTDAPWCVPTKRSGVRTARPASAAPGCAYW